MHWGEDRDHLDLGRPDQVSLIFDRKVRMAGPRRTPGSFRTKVITDGSTPRSSATNKYSRIKQYVRHEAHRCIPGTVGRNLEDYSWVADLPESERRTGKTACPESSGRLKASRAGRCKTRVIGQKLDCLKPNLHSV